MGRLTLRVAGTAVSRIEGRCVLSKAEAEETLTIEVHLPHLTSPDCNKMHKHKQAYRGVQK